MADNTATAKKQMAGQRAAVREHIDKYKRYQESYEKEVALKTVRRAQEAIAKLKRAHPSLQHDSDSVDTWNP